MRLNRFISGAFLCASIVAGSACSASFSTGTSLSQSKVEKQLSDILRQKTDTKPEKVSCPGDLKGEENTVMTCSVSADGETHDVKITVTDVKGSDIRFRYEVTNPDGSTTPHLDQTRVEKKVADVLEQEVGQRPENVRCPGPLIGKIGETMRCKLIAGTDELGLTVTVTSVKDSSINFDVQVDG